MIVENKSNHIQNKNRRPQPNGFYKILWRCKDRACCGGRCQIETERADIDNVNSDIRYKRTEGRGEANMTYNLTSIVAFLISMQLKLRNRARSKLHKY